LLALAVLEGGSMGGASPRGGGGGGLQTASYP